MNDTPIKTQMTRQQLTTAVERYWNNMLCGSYTVAKMEMHARSSARGIALTVELEPLKKEPREGEDHVE